MYDELEQAAGAPTRSGSSVLGWIGVALVAVLLLGAAGTYLAYRFVRHQVEVVAERFEEFDLGAADGRSVLMARTVVRTLDALGAGSGDSEVLTDAVGRALAEAPRPARAPQAAADGEERVDGSFRIRTGEGEFTADLRGDAEGGSLVVRRPDGRAIVDLRTNVDGGRLQLGVDGDVAFIEAGPEAGAPPRWVPIPDDQPQGPRRSVSGRAGPAEFGALAWTSSTDPEQLVDAWRADVQGDGWELQAEHRLDAELDGRSASAVARAPDADRVVVFVAGREAGDTRVVLAWGERVGGGG